ncbi:MAG: hypothetical protein M3O30_17105 [Planctomycetota bacterium]|nr:hypothetical protein [Planctomycetota bacterium]
MKSSTHTAIWVVFFIIILGEVFKFIRLPPLLDAIFWVLFCVESIVASNRSIREIRRNDLRTRGICKTCGYDVRATPDRCPECGTVPVKNRVGSTPIEQALFSNAGAHWVSTFTNADGLVAITLHPWNRPDLLTYATFEEARILSVDSSYAKQHNSPPPWDIIGFDCKSIRDHRWRYCLYTDAVEYRFEASWPSIVVAGS